MFYKSIEKASISGVRVSVARTGVFGIKVTANDKPMTYEVEVVFKYGDNNN